LFQNSMFDASYKKDLKTILRSIKNEFIKFYLWENSIFDLYFIFEYFSLFSENSKENVFSLPNLSWYPWDVTYQCVHMRCQTDILEILFAKIMVFCYWLNYLLRFERVIVHRERELRRGWRRTEGGRTSWR